MQARADLFVVEKLGFAFGAVVPPKHLAISLNKAA
jgi:hypothetical protein